MTLTRLHLLLEPCQTIDELDNHIRTFFDLDLPFDVVDEESTSSPLLFLWTVYQTFLTGKGPSRHVVAASRNSAKTLTSSILQWYSVTHFRRDGVHIAATLDQSTSAIRYLDKFLSLPELAPFRSTDNARTKRLVGMPGNDFTTRPEATLRVVTATKRGANSPRASCLTYDEVDLLDPEIIKESVYIADPSQDRHRFNPAFIFLSSRKSNDGPIQKLIDEADGPKGKDGRIKLHKWALVDYMENCPASVHHPDKPIEAFLNTETLQMVWGRKNFESQVSEAGRATYKNLSMFEGCMTCPAAVACQGRAPKQKSDSRMLRTRSFVGDILDAVGDPAVIIAQSLNWRPEVTGLVFNIFSQRKHVKGPVEFYKWVAGRYFNPDNLPELELEHLLFDVDGGTLKQIERNTPTKIDIYNEMLRSGWKIHYGVDYGWTDPATCVVVGYHRDTRRACILHVDHTTKDSRMDNRTWSEYIVSNIWPLLPGHMVSPDLADAASPSYFGTLGVPCLQKKPHRIETGVSQIRGLLWNPISQTSNFTILYMGEGDKTEMCINEMSTWAYKKSLTGQWDFGAFDTDHNNHTIDAIRYALDPFVKDLQVRMNAKQIEPETIQTTREFLEASEESRKKFLDQDVKKQFQDFMMNEHGLADIFSGERKLAAMRQAEQFNKQMRAANRAKTEQAVEIAPPPDDTPTTPKKSRLKYSF